MSTPDRDRLTYAERTALRLIEAGGTVTLVNNGRGAKIATAAESFTTGIGTLRDLVQMRLLREDLTAVPR